MSKVSDGPFRLVSLDGSAEMKQLFQAASVNIIHSMACARSKRAEKSETLNHEELQIADQKVEYLRGAITSILKKISPNGPTSELEKLMKKTLEFQLGTTLLEESRQSRECLLFQYILKESGLIEQQLGRENADHEMKVEELVYTPLQNVLENEFPTVLKHKHALRKYCLDKDSASNRYNATKKETVKEDLEEADNKVEQSRDQLAIEMFNILSKENEFSEYILQLLKLQRGYHESALKNLETVIPQLEKKIGNSPVRKVFGTALKEHLRITGKRIAYPLEICISTLSHYGILEEGLFRVAGSSAKIKRLKLSIDSGCFSVLIPEYRDAHVLASLLKLYLRELPEPLLTFYLHKEWINAMQYQGTQRLETIKNIIEKLPQENKDNLSYLIQFLSQLSQHPENKMSASNIAIVLSPNLLWCKDDEESTNMGNCVLVNMLVEYFIKEADVLFPTDVGKYVSVTRFFHEEEIVRCNKINNDLKPDSPRPSTRKKKSAPIPPSQGNYDITKFNKNLDNMRDHIGVYSDSVRENSNENIKVSSPTQKQQNDHLESVAQYSHILGQDLPLQHLDEKEVILDNKSISKTHPVPDTKQHAFTDSTNELSNTSKHSTAHNQPFTDNKCSVITINSHRIENIDSQIRQKDSVNRPGKPEVPARPLSLTKKTPDHTDAAFKKTHCSLYNVADKMHPSIINIRRDNEPPPTKHDVLSVEKTEKVVKVGENATFENKSDISPPCNITTIKINRSESTDKFETSSDSNSKAKSNEQLNYIENVYTIKKNCDRKSSHTRAKSDGGIMDLEGDGSYTQVSSISSRNLSKPTQPPPPPPGV